jgi:hypothetical protein
LSKSNKFCVECGTDLAFSAKFCSSCGQAQGGQAKTVAVSTEIENTEIKKPGYFLTWLVWSVGILTLTAVVLLVLVQFGVVKSEGNWPTNTSGTLQAPDANVPIKPVDTSFNDSFQTGKDAYTAARTLQTWNFYRDSRINCTELSRDYAYDHYDAFMKGCLYSAPGN